MSGKVLSDITIRELIEKGHIINADPKLLNSSSLDVRIGADKWKIVGSTTPVEGQSVKDLLKVPTLVDARHHEAGEFYHDMDQPILFQLVEELNLPQGVSARILNKSGRGRIGISTRGVCDGMPRFNDIPQGYKGKLYAEIAPTTFPLLVYGGETSIPQIRFYEGDPKPMSGDALEELLESENILFDKNDQPIRFSKRDLDRICRTGRLTFTANFSRGLLAYRAIRDRRVLDLSKKNYYRPELFYEEVRATKGEKGINIPPGVFVLIISNEKIRLPPKYAVEIAEYTPELGDIKTHYAALVNAGHGHDPSKPNGGTGDRIVLEARARDLPVYWQHGRIIAEFEIYKMDRKPEIVYKMRQTTNFDSLKSILPDIFKKD